MEKITIYTHGSSRENPGPAAIGIYIVDSEDKVLKEGSETIGNATNDFAEYFAVVRGLQTAANLFEGNLQGKEFELKLESELVTKQLCAKLQINDVGLIGHFIEIYNIRVASFPNLKVTQIKDKHNRQARILVDEALDV